MRHKPLTTGPVRKSQFPMTDELVAFLRHRVATRFYDQPQVIDVVARAILREVKGSGAN